MQLMTYISVSCYLFLCFLSCIHSFIDLSAVYIFMQLYGSLILPFYCDFQCSPDLNFICDIRLHERGSGVFWVQGFVSTARKVLYLSQNVWFSFVTNRSSTSLIYSCGIIFQFLSSFRVVSRTIFVSFFSFFIESGSHMRNYWLYVWWLLVNLAKNCWSTVMFQHHVTIRIDTLYIHNGSVTLILPY